MGFLSDAVRELEALDRAVYEAIADTPTSRIDEPLRRLSDAANFSRPWLVIAAGLAFFGGRTGRRAALNGVAAIGLTSFVVNVMVKSLPRRKRPDRAEAGVPEGRHVRMPVSSSFPSGHSASGFAFAAAVGDFIPVLAVPLRFMAGAVAYSRVHTGVHYPGDAIVGWRTHIANLSGISAGVVKP